MSSILKKLKFSSRWVRQLFRVEQVRSSHRLLLFFCVGHVSFDDVLLSSMRALVCRKHFRSSPAGTTAAMKQRLHNCFIHIGSQPRSAKGEKHKK